MSFEFYRRAHSAIAQGSLTNSKRVETMIKGITPTHCLSGEGPFLVGCDKKKYIDYCCANGTNLFGYENPELKRARNSAPMGPYSLGSVLEIECAELVKNHFPFVDKVRFLKTGTEACMSAIKIARAHTGRDKVLTHGYHGWSDDFVSLSPPAFGVPKRSFIESFTDLNQIDESAACVIVEPILTELSDDRLKFLQDLKDKCRSVGALLIFDEVITGFRWPLLSFSKHSGIHPDIICLGKAMAGGMALSCIGLGRGIGEGKEWFVSSTFAGEPAPLVVFKKVIELLNNKYSLDQLWSEGKYFLEKFNALNPDKIFIEGYPTRGVFKGDPNYKAIFWQECHKAGILFGASWFIGFQHIGLTDQVINSCSDIVQKIKTNKVKLEGEPPSSPFAQKVREK